MSTRRIIGYTVHDSLDAWALDPDPDARPCYTSECAKRYVWTGPDARRKARAWIKSVRADDTAIDIKGTKYWLVKIVAKKKRKRNGNQLQG